MGLSIEFYAGHAPTIGAAFSHVDFDELRDGRKSIAYADLSLHIGLEDIDLLSAVIADHTETPSVGLLDGITANVGTIADEGSADVVDPAWVAMVSALDVAHAPVIAADWIRRVGEANGETLEATDDAAVAVRALVGLCKKALAAGADVVCVWYL
jgi:hypothetical protein